MNRQSVIGLTLTMVLLAASSSRGQELQDKHQLEAAEREVLMATVTETGVDAKVSVTERGGGTVILVRKPPRKPTPEEVEEALAEAKPTPAPAKAAEETPDYSVSEENFDVWVFGGVTGLEARRSWLDVDLKVKLKEAAADKSLTEAEAAKLRMAGRGDIKRFFDSVEASRREFDAVRADYLKGIKVLTTLRPLSKDFSQGLFGDSSLFTKTLAKILADRATSRP